LITRNYTVNTGLAFLIQNIMLGVGLAMDSFSMSIADTLSEPEMSRKKGLAIAGTFGFCQMLFPLIGWLLVHTLISMFSTLELMVPWAALIMLGYIGGGMIKDGLSPDDGSEMPNHPVTAPQLVLQGIATAIDALSVGLTIAEYGFSDAFSCAFTAGAVTFAVCIAGLSIGRRLGEKIGNKASILGGCILIIIGIKVFLEHIL